MTDSGEDGLAAAVALAGRAGRYALDELGGLVVGDLDRPTPCTDWDVASVVTHLADVVDALTGLLATAQLNLPGPPGSPVGEPVARTCERVQDLLEQLQAAGRRGSHDLQADGAAPAAQAAAIEFTVHGWDVAAARGRACQLPPDLAEDVLTLASELLDDASRGRRSPPGSIPGRTPRRSSGW
ncbi:MULTISPECIES: maleylpyruvate isomerase family mycothiol-dependent enzyme [unclassified Modestobacter]|uniref:maleylpyruvate isomerase family mycothiol-dependent enzyme n=1 Tax=unclassified Modestobacter TaxID=2643866 RepID=UPI0022AB3F79|nr:MULTISPECIES: maleylpyruvate isomerase family mycothiol-dependent enzyme [unclassified Modestobacter]MCZ2825916.1 maleylpyruvate isomerase family mycothiol-dependent enzyme [Modestobacter sp. VKM Ac-2981]MCZ2853019.1 maleylpyruvate isomerase family mycothiol-dependent enzyme [Modestobacter sp. VKM Ac-2982]